jgi:hypothetical protein
MKLDFINAEQRLYVMPCAGGGFTCYGFDTLDRRARAVAAWCKVIPPLADLGTRGHFEQCAAIMDAGERYARKTGKRCEAELIAQLDGFEGKRVEVVDRHGERRRFWIGKSTGWMPCHLEITRRTSCGPAVTGEPFKSVQIIKE